MGLRMLAYGSPAYSWDAALQMAKDTIIKCMKVFAKIVVHVYGPWYLRAPNVEDTTRLLTMHEAKYWSGFLGSVDCMHRKWRDCPAA